MLIIDKSTLLGKGKFRACYIHPLDSTKCIKVSTTDNHKPSLNDIKAHAYLEKKNKSLAMIAKLYGTETTDLGEGLVCELICDYDGEISKSFADCLRTELEPEFIAQLRKAYIEFKEYIFSEKIILRDLNAPNLLYRRTSENEGTFIIIDGIGDSDFIPVSNFLEFWAKIKIERKWKRFEIYLHKFFGDSMFFR